MQFLTVYAFAVMALKAINKNRRSSLRNDITECI